MEFPLTYEQPWVTRERVAAATLLPGDPGQGSFDTRTRIGASSMPACVPSMRLAVIRRHRTILTGLKQPSYSRVDGNGRAGSTLG